MKKIFSNAWKHLKGFFSDYKRRKEPKADYKELYKQEP